MDLILGSLQLDTDTRGTAEARQTSSVDGCGFIEILSPTGRRISVLVHGDAIHEPVQLITDRGISGANQVSGRRTYGIHR